jgi:hypothetical protein
MDSKMGGPTVNVAGPEVMPPRLAVIVAVPWNCPVARPCDPAALLMAATELAGIPSVGVEVEVQVTCVVRSCVDWSE